MIQDTNIRLFEFLHGFADRSVIFGEIGVLLGHYFPILLLFFIAGTIFLFPSSRRRAAFLGEAALSAILSRGVVTEAIRYFYSSLRPSDVLNFTPLIERFGNGFPSAHMTFFAALATTVFFWNRKRGIWCLAATLMIGIARVAAGVHWPSDILAGIVIGIASASAIRFLVRSYLPPALPVSETTE